MSYGSLDVPEKAIRYPRVALELNPNKPVLTMKKRSASMWALDEVEQS